MTEEQSPGRETSHAERLQRKKPNRSLKVLPSNSKEAWPANLGELLEWHSNEVEDVTRAAQLRLREAGNIIRDYRQGKISFEEAARSAVNHDTNWGDALPGGIQDSLRGKNDEEARKAIEEVWEAKRQGRNVG